MNALLSGLSRRLFATQRSRVVSIVVALAVLAVGITMPLTLGEKERPGAKPLARIPTAAETGCGPNVIAPRQTTPLTSWSRLAVAAAADCYTLVANKKDLTGIAPDTNFTLTVARGASVRHLATRLRISPHLRLSVTAVKGHAGRFHVFPGAAMKPGSVYRFSIVDAGSTVPARTWAFQVQEDLRVVETLPANKATSVPRNTGIELTFSHDGVTGAPERFTITPATPGRFETHGRVLVFVPKSLKSRTLYTVTLKAGVRLRDSSKATTAPFTFRFETGATVRSGETPLPPLQFTHAVWESPVAGLPALGMFAEGGSAPKTVSVRVYRLASPKAFLASLTRFTSIPAWASSTRAYYRAPIGRDPPVLSFTASLKTIGQSGDVYFQLPQRLPAGYYIVQARPKGPPLQAWLQVTDIATYVAVSARNTLVWVNDLAREAPIAGATVRVAGGSFSKVSGRDGVAFFATPSSLIRLMPDPLGSTAEAVGNLLVTATDGRTALVPLADIFTGFHEYNFREFLFEGNPTPYWRFLYTDRHLYHPTDTIHFWGLIRSREHPLPSRQIRLQAVEYAESGGQSVVAETSTSAGSRGTFLGTLDVASLDPGYFELRALVGDRVVASTSFQVQDFVKPAYKIDVTPSKKAVFVRDQVAFAVKASFFEGTPVPNLGLRYEQAVSGTTTTNAEGATAIRYVAKLDDPYIFGGYQWATVAVTPKLAEEGEINGAASVQVFPAALTIDATSLLASGKGTVTGTVSNVDLSRINKDRAADFEDYRGAAASGRTVRADVTEESWRRVEDGESYDFISKRVVKKYRYDQVTRPVGTYTAKTDARGRFTIAFAASNDKSYQVDLSVTDDARRIYRTRVWVGRFFIGNDQDPYLVADAPGPFAPGARVGVRMRLGASDLPSGGSNHYLFYQARDGLREYRTQRTPSYGFIFGAKHVPNIEVLGVRFTGTDFQEVSSGFGAVFDKELRRLRVAVRPRKTSYRPGDKATLDVSVTDRAGKPVEGAEVLLSAVDEAIFRLQEQDFLSSTEIVDSLYEPVASGVLRTLASHRSPAPSAGGESGGEGGARDNFRDTALFSRVTTGSDGKATGRFSIPSNLTSWRVTALAITGDLRAGSGIGFVPVALPVFVDVAANSTYLVSDRPAIRARAFGTAVHAGERAEFTLEAPSLLSRPVTVSGKAFEPADLPLANLKEGFHILTVRVRAGSSIDAVKRMITVLPSRLVRTATLFAEIRAGGIWTPVGNKDGRTTVVLSDRNRGRYYAPLLELSYSSGDRVDQMLARNMAQELLQKYFNERSELPALFVASRYQTSGGGVAIFPYADKDLTLTARVAALAADRFGRSGLERYLRSVLGDTKETRERVIIALYGMSALGRPVLGEVQAFASRSDLTLRERLYLGLAAAEIGDEDTAKRIYRDVLAQFGQTRGDMIRVLAGETPDQILEATALEAILGAAIGDDNAPLLFAYSTQNATNDLLISLEEISYLTAALPRLPVTPVKFSYALRGVRHTESLEKGRTISLSLTPPELRGLSLTVADGALGVSSSFLAAFDPSKVKRDPAATVSRTYEAPLENGRIVVHENDLVEIRLDWNLTGQAVDGCYQVTDLLPSGLRAVTRPYDRGIGDQLISWPYAIEGQRVSFCVSRADNRPSLVYYARVIGTGLFTAEPAFIQSQAAAESFNVGEAQEIQIS